MLGIAASQLGLVTGHSHSTGISSGFTHVVLDTGNHKMKSPKAQVTKIKAISLGKPVPIYKHSS